MKSQNFENTLSVLANAAELTRCIVQGVAGNDVADTINGAPVLRQTLYDLMLARFQQRVVKHLGDN